MSVEADVSDQVCRGRNNEMLVLWCCSFPAWNTLKLSIASAVTVGIPWSSMIFSPCDDFIADRVRQSFPKLKMILPENPYYDRSFSTSFHEFGSDGFAIISYQRYIAIDHLLKSFTDRVLYLDTDVIFFRNPINYLMRLSLSFPYSILMQDDTMNDQIDWLSLGTACGWPGGARSWRATERMCGMGFGVWSAVPSQFEILSHMKQRQKELLLLSKSEELGVIHQDQAEFNEIKHRYKVDIQLLPAKYFPNGSTLRSDSKGSVNDVAFILHANWLKGTALKEKIMWSHVPLSALSPSMSVIEIAKNPEFNCALKKRTMQSSSIGFEDVSATNGDVLQDFGFHTRRDMEPWWIVDLETCIALRNIIIVDRLGFSERSDGLQVFVSSDLVSWKLVYEKPIQGASNVVLIAAIETSARFVRCSLPREGDLHLSQVILMSDGTPPVCLDHLTFSE